METVQIRLPEKLLRMVDSLVKEKRFSSRSEAIRTIISEWERLTETLSILSDPELLRDIKRGMSDIRKGKLIPHDKIKREFY